MPQTLVNVVLPAMGESVTEGSVTSWRKKPGERVEAGEPLVDVTTDKVDVEVPATASGTLTRILVEEGKTVAVGAPLAEIDTAGQAMEGATPARPLAPAAAAPAAATPQAPAPTPAPPDSEVALPDPRSYAEPPPLARRRSESGAAPAQAPALAASEPLPADAKATSLRGPAGSLVKHMENSLGIPTATSFRTFNVDVLDGRRRSLNAALKAAGRKEKISFTHIIAFAIVRAAGAVPGIYATFRRDGENLQRVDRGLHLGLAVDVRKPDDTRMLVVPVVRDAAGLDFARFHAAYESLVEKARSGDLSAAALTGATLTLTNPGGIGTSASVPRLMAGQGAIIAAGAIGYPPGFDRAGEEALRGLRVGKIMTLTSTYDHRIIQGAQSGEFLRRIEELLNGADGFYETLFTDLQLTAPAQSSDPAGKQTQPSAGPEPHAAGSVASGDTELARAGAAAMSLVSRYRHHGVNVAHLDPLSDSVPSDRALDPATVGLDDATLQKLPANTLRVYASGKTAADVLAQLRDTYASTIAYDVEHISNHEQRSWLRQQIESGAHRKPLSRERKLELLERLTRVESFERYLRKAFLGQKTFSIEGLDNMIPMLEEMLIMLADEGVAEVHMGMAHRGRLAVITHVVDRPYEEVLAEFEHAQMRGLVHREGDVTGDVKYHQGAHGTYETHGTKIRVVLAHNPSHLEAVDSVVEGQTRAVQTDRTPNIAQLDLRRAAAILIHGDAAFSAQGTVAEVFNFQSLPGYTTGGTLHIIANNQIGFTTLPPQGRSTRYASDLAKGYDVPVVHVNADDLEACIAAVHLAVEFRRTFHRDTVIDLIGYRRFGHNEADEPAYT
ncbi:MAG: thiamine pyrophosphate-dependent enzyme, partial [Candidatus Eremiobacteraeota bacterium]|nr:thiamine pyrophosphate-dependent enzyme [Candidatus Eremiobacteraeota bacterium]